MASRRETTPRAYHHGDLRAALIDASVELVDKDQDWTFSLREVARRAGVSHNAPFNHFPDKRYLLDAVAGVGFEELSAVMRSTADGISNVAEVLKAIARAYVDFALANPARYRLMFGSELIPSEDFQPEVSARAGDEAKRVLRDVILLGATGNEFCVDSEDRGEVSTAVLTVWSAVHGLSMLLIDSKSEMPAKPGQLVDEISQTLIEGLRRR